MLVEAGQRLLPAFSGDLSQYAQSRLERLGVEVRVGQAVEEISSGLIKIAGQDEPVGLVIWAAGVSASPLAKQLGPTDRAGRIAVDGQLAVTITRTSLQSCKSLEESSAAFWRLALSLTNIISEDCVP